MFAASTPVLIESHEMENGEFGIILSQVGTRQGSMCVLFCTPFPMELADEHKKIMIRTSSVPVSGFLRESQEPSID
jgi:hypothetical protein